jgi:hypothetical protein
MSATVTHYKGSPVDVRMDAYCASEVRTHPGYTEVVNPREPSEYMCPRVVAKTLLSQLNNHHICNQTAMV